MIILPFAAIDTIAIIFVAPVAMVVSLVRVVVLVPEILRRKSNVLWVTGMGEKSVGDRDE